MHEIREILSKWTLRITLPLLFALGLFPRCANVVAPQGGPRDTLPPVIVEMTPAFGTTNFEAKRIFIEFDEYVKLVDQHKEFYTSPRMERKPSLMIKGRGVQIDIQDTLLDNTTYSFNFGSSLRDNNEGNPLHGLRYVFSTGDHIDSLIMSGYTADGYKGDSMGKTFIFFYEAWKDSVPDYDSTVFNAVPDVIARSQGNGIFIAENLKPVDYRVYAIQDNNTNQTYEPGVDRIGFLDSVYNPLTMPGFDIWYDTIRLYLTADPQLYFRMFMDDPFKRQYFAGQSRPNENLLVLKFGAPYPDIEKLEFFNLDPDRIITEYLKPEKDSIALWIDGFQGEIPDTIKGELIYYKHDSINNMVLDTQRLSLGWKIFESRQQERERLRREKEREDMIAAGEEPEPEPNPFRVKVEGGSEINPEKNIAFVFDYPLTLLDSARISLDRLERTAPAEGEEEGTETLTPVPHRFVQDSTNMRRWVLEADWVQEWRYRLIIPEGAFRNVVGEVNDTLRSEFGIQDPEKYATIVLNVTGKTPDSEYVIQLLSTSGSVLNEIRHAVTGRYQFNYVDPGTVRLRVIEDDNRNGEWDKGNLVERIQSERVEIYQTDTGEADIPTKMNWELTYDLDMNELFAPVTMEGLSERLRKEEQIRVTKWLQEREKANRFQPPSGQLQPGGGNNQNDPFGSGNINNPYGNTNNPYGQGGGFY